MPFSAPAAGSLILVVNDQADQVRLLEELLTSAGFSVVTAFDGTEGLRVAEQQSPDVIVSDVMMPRMDGITMCRHIRQHADLRTTPILLVSAHRQDSESVLEGFAAGADDYLTVPFDPARLVAQVTRLTERRRTDVALRHSEAQVRLLLDSTAEAIFAVDAEGGCTMCNRAGLEMLGYDTLAQILGRTMHTLVHHTTTDGVDYPGEQCHIFHAIRQGTAAHGDDEYLYRRDGTSFPVEYWSHPIRRDGQLVGAVVTFFDITERKRAEEALDVTTAHLKAVVSTVPIALWAIDQNGIITLSEGKLLERLGFTAGELTGQSVFEVYRDEPTVIDTVRRALAGESLAVTIAVRGITFESVYAPARGAHGEVTGAISISIDVSERTRLAAQVRQGQKMEAVGRLAAGVAHDFNNLLTAIIGFSDLALLTLEPGHVARPDIERVIQAGKSAGELTRQLLTFSRQQILRPQIVDLNSIIRRMEPLVRRTIPEHTQIVTNLSDAIGRVNADPGQIEQALMNLAVNARDAMPTGGVLTIETRDVQLEEAQRADHPDMVPGPYVVLTVRDTGVGMDESVLAHIFEPFFTTKELGKGTGLGLATVYGIVKQSGGSIGLSSTRGEGTAFNIYLPKVAGVADAEAPREVALPARGSETILLVEDQSDARSVTRATLARHGYNVIEASNGVDALRVLREHARTIELLLTDLVIPGISGFDLGRQARELRADIRVLYTSGYTDKAYTDNQDLPPAFIPKPFTTESLLRKVSDTLRKG